MNAEATNPTEITARLVRVRIKLDATAAANIARSEQIKARIDH